MMSLTTMIIGITVLFCVAFLYISNRVKGQASSSFSQYAIGGGTFPLYLVVFTQIATIMGAGNFIGHATSGFTKGISHIPFVIGEQGSKIVFGLLFAGLAGKFTYNTLSGMMHDLIHRDKISKAIVGLLTMSIMLAWLGGQAKGLGYVFEQFTGIDSLPVIIFFNIIFIIYTYLGGIVSVAWTDLIQGIVVVVFSAIFYISAFQPVNWSLAELGTRAIAIAGEDYWSLSNVPVGTILVNFITGCLGALVAQCYWQRCFASKDSKTARNSLLIGGVYCLIAVSLTALVGIVARVLNPGLDPSLAMPWLIMNYTPKFVAATVFALILAAAMSSADSYLNSAAVILVDDIIRPFMKDDSDEKLVKYAKVATIIIGVVACFLSIFAESIIGMFSKAYTMAGGGVAPVLIVGLLWKKDRTKEFTMGTKNSNVTAWGARVGLLSGAIVSLTISILWGVAISAISTIVVSLLTKGTPAKKGTVEA